MPQRPMSQPVILVCGVPGSGKTWVCLQLEGKFKYVPHDLYYNRHAEVIVEAAKISLEPVITECPFAERLLRDQLEQSGLKVHPYFVIVPPKLVAERYQAREQKPIPKNFLTRAVSIKTRAREWDAPMGTGEEILELLKEWK